MEIFPALLSFPNSSIGIGAVVGLGGIDLLDAACSQGPGGTDLSDAVCSQEPGGTGLFDVACSTWEPLAFLPLSPTNNLIQTFDTVAES